MGDAGSCISLVVSSKYVKVLLKTESTLNANIQNNPMSFCIA